MRHDVFPINQALLAVQERASGFSADLGIILGSGLNSLVDLIEDPIAISYQDIPGFHVCGTPGHAGVLHLGRLAGVSVACLQGRPHYYEGVGKAALQGPLQLLKALECQAMLITCSVGSLHEDIRPGQLVLIKDHINFQGHNPLVGQTAFVGLENAYDAPWRARIQKVAQKRGVKLSEGVYVGTLGPCFETPAEIRAFQSWGSDVVGMSTISEVIMARFLGLKVCVVSAVTNMAAGLGAEKLTHDLTLKGASSALADLSSLLTGIIEDFRQWTTPQR